MHLLLAVVLSTLLGEHALQAVIYSLLGIAVTAHAEAAQKRRASLQAVNTVVVVVVVVVATIESAVHAILFSNYTHQP